jgi:hypothetical protein
MTERSEVDEGGSGRIRGREERKRLLHRDEKVVEGNIKTDSEVECVGERRGRRVWIASEILVVL